MLRRRLVLFCLILLSVALIHHSRIARIGSVFGFSQIEQPLQDSPSPASSCLHLECPPYEIVHEESDFEIRLYKNATWTETEGLMDFSFVAATNAGFKRLFQYIQGANANGSHIAMTAPVVTSIRPSAGPFCSSAFIVKFLLPSVFWSEPPLPNPDLALSSKVEKLHCVAVRKFQGFATDFNVAREAKHLSESLLNSEWAFVVEQKKNSTTEESYAIAQYNSPFEIFNRVNEVWVSFKGSSTSGEKVECHYGSLPSLVSQILMNNGKEGLTSKVVL